MDAWPVKDKSGRQWWFLGPDGGATQPDINGKPVNIRVSMQGPSGIFPAGLLVVRLLLLVKRPLVA